VIWAPRGLEFRGRARNGYHCARADTTRVFDGSRGGHGQGGVVPSVVELRGGGPVSELSQTVEAATSGAAVAMVV